MRTSKAEAKKIRARAKDLRELFAEFGAHLSGFDPGATAFLVREPVVAYGQGSGCFGEHLSFNSPQWGWLEPLLKELREYRRQSGKLSAPSMEVFYQRLKKMEKDAEKAKKTEEREMRQWLRPRPKARQRVRR